MTAELQSFFGFFLTKRVVASSSVEARQSAVQAAWQDPKIAGQEKNVPTPSIEAKVLHELPPSNEMKDTGYTLFEMDAE